MVFKIQHERCHSCEGIVYLTEKLALEEKDSKKVFHKSCFKCIQCNKVLQLMNYAALDGKIYCKPHYNQMFAKKGSYNFEGKSGSSYNPMSGPKSFVPVEGGEQNSSSSYSSQRRDTPNAVATRLRAFQKAEKCHLCDTSVFVTERLVIEDKDAKRVFHKQCFKCKQCNRRVDSGSYASLDGIIYCRTHYNQIMAKTRSSDISTFGGGSPTRSGCSGPKSFIPVEQTKSSISEYRKDTPSSVSKRFSFHSNLDKCVKCSKTVYVTEKLVFEDKGMKHIYHKACFSCAHCKKIVTLSNYSSMNGEIYCNTHFNSLFKNKASFMQAGVRKFTWADAGGSPEDPEEAKRLKEEEEALALNKKLEEDREKERLEREEREQQELERLKKEEEALALTKKLEEDREKEREQQEFERLKREEEMKEEEEEMKEEEEEVKEEEEETFEEKMKEEEEEIVEEEIKEEEEIVEEEIKEEEEIVEEEIKDEDIAEEEIKEEEEEMKEEEEEEMKEKEEEIVKEEIKEEEEEIKEEEEEKVEVKEINKKEEEVTGKKKRSRKKKKKSKK